MNQYPLSVWLSFFDLVCSGMAPPRAAAEVGVSYLGARKRWRKACPVSVAESVGRYHRLGPSPADDPNDPGKDPDAPDARRALTMEDRAMIAAGLAHGDKPAKIARDLGRHRSVIGREIARNHGPDGTYHAGLAHRAAHVARKRPKTPKLVADEGLRDDVTCWLEQGWSPGPIGSVLRQDHPGQDLAARMGRVSGETIYKALYVQTRGSLRAVWNDRTFRFRYDCQSCLPSLPGPAEVCPRMRP